MEVTAPRRSAHWQMTEVVVVTVAVVVVVAAEWMSAVVVQWGQGDCRPCKAERQLLLLLLLLLQIRIFRTRRLGKTKILVIHASERSRSKCPAQPLPSSLMVVP